MEQEINLSVLNIVAEIELVYKSKVKPSQRPQIKSSLDCYKLLSETWEQDKIDFVEQFRVVLLNRANKVLVITTLSTGGVSGTIADPKLIFAAALKANACNFIISHNHPSGNLKPSKADEDLTNKIKSAAKFLD